MGGTAVRSGDRAPGQNLLAVTLVPGLLHAVQLAVLRQAYLAEATA